MAGRKIRWIVVVVGVLAVLAVLVILNLGPSSGSGIEVKIENVKRQPLASWVRAPGTLEAVTQVKVSSNIPGRVEALYVEEGDWVEEDQALLNLDDIRYLSSVEQIRAQLESAQARLRQAEAEFRQAESLFARKRQLLDNGLISAEEFEDSRTQYDIKSASLEAQKREIDRQRAALRASERDLEETQLLAPVTGLVTRILVEEGENVVTGTMNNPGTVILEMADLSEMEVEAEVDETDIIAVSRGQAARIEVDALPDSVFRGRVSRVGQSGRTSQEGADFLVRVRLEDSPSTLRPGMTADVEILVATAENALTIPLQALTVRPQSKVDEWAGKDQGENENENENEDGPGDSGDSLGGSEGENPEMDLDRWLDAGTATGDEFVEGVFIAEEGKAEFRPVRTGFRGEAEIQILEGLSEGEEVITGPYRVLRTLEAGRAVRPEKETGEEEEEEGEDE
jgi:HlyD family secretion protein